MRPIVLRLLLFLLAVLPGLPGLNGFVSEFMCLFAAFQSDGIHWQQASGELLTGATAVLR